METGIDRLTWYPLDCLGRGRQPVFRGEWHLSSSHSLPVAIKIIRQDMHTTEDELLNKLLHRNIVHCHGRFSAPYVIRENVPNAYEIILFEYIEGQCLFDYLEKSHPIMEIEDITRQLLDVVNYLHSMYIVHYDIHPFNIIISRKDGICLKLLDFGAALDFTDPQTLSNNPHTSFQSDHQIDVIQVSQIIKTLLSCAEYPDNGTRFQKSKL